MFQKLARKVSSLPRALRRARLRQRPVQPDRIVFSNFDGNGYGCNPKYIAEEILRRKLPYDLVWLAGRRRPTLTAAFPRGIRLVDYHSAQALYEMAGAKIWINNVRSNPFFARGFTKKEGQTYIQTWHGSFGIKKLDAASANLVNNLPWVERAKFDSSCVDYILSNGSFDNWVFSTSFWYEGKIFECGHPRNDIFFADTTHIRDKVSTYLGIDDDTRYVLYVPSFRDDMRVYPYWLNTGKLIEVLQERFGGEWVVVVRLHPRLKKFHGKALFPASRRVIPASLYDDMQELLACADAVISDYSSCLFDFLLTGRPAFVYSADLEEYEGMRGFYYRMEETPFPIATSNRALRENILSFDHGLYRERAAAFLRGKGSVEDGKASSRVVDLIRSIMEGKEP
jgi:CDP-glycerol glycerophosphotransferase